MNNITISGDITLYWLPIDTDTALTRPQREEKTIAEIITSVFGPGCRRQHNHCGAPFVADATGNVLPVAISISHSRTIGAICTAPQNSLIGVDVEEERPQLQRVARRVMTAAEYEYYSALPHGLLRAWTMKEALYKASRTALGSEVDCTKQLALPQPGRKAHVLRPDGTILAYFDTFEHRLTDHALITIVKQINEL